MDITEFLGVWKGYRIGSIQRFEVGDKGDTSEVWIELHPIKRRRMKCSGCGQFVSRVHDHVERWVRDLPVLGAQTRLLVWRRRVSCSSCGPKLEELPWLGRYARVTRRMAESVARLCSVASVKHVAEFFGLSWGRVKNIEKRYLAETLGEVDLSGLTALAMDEFALQKGQRYVTVIVEPYAKRVLWVGKGRSKESIRPFFEKLGPARCQEIKAVAMDMNGAFEAEVRAQCPKAEIIYDLFHVVAKYGREVVDKVRKEEAKRVAGDNAARTVIKGARWLLLRNKRNIRRQEDQIRLYDLLRIEI